MVLISLHIVAGPGMVEAVWLRRERALFCITKAMILYLFDFHSIKKREGEIWIEMAKMGLQKYRWLVVVTLILS